MAMFTTLIADKILKASPFPIFAPYNPSNAQGTAYTWPEGRFYSNVGTMDFGPPDHATAPAYIQLWSGNDGIQMRATNHYSNNIMTGGNGNDVILGNATYDHITGGHGDDIIVGGGGNDVLYGQFGSNVIIGGYKIANTPDSSFLSSWQDMFNRCKTEAEVAAKFIDVGGNVIADGGNLSDYILTGSGRDTVSGGSGDDTIFSGSGDDTVMGDAHRGVMGWDGTNTGNDYIDAGAGDDLVMGNSGNDTLFGGDGKDIIWGDTDPSDKYYTGVADTGKDLIYGGSGDDEIHGGAGDDTIYGDNGNDILDATKSYNDKIYGDEGNDLIFGGIGDDEIHGGVGNDSISGDNGNDKLFGDAGNDLIYGGIGDDTISGGAGADSISGDDGNDTIFGDDGDDILVGGMGYDDLHGGAGNDALYGGDGDDFYYLEGQFGQDQVFENAGEGTNDRVIFEDLTINQVVYGRSGNDLMFGDATQTNIVAVKDWFTNFGIDSFWFTTGTTGQYNYVTAEAIANAFGVQIPTTGTAAANDALFAEADAVSDAAVGYIAGETLAPVAVEVLGVNFAQDVVAHC